MKRHLIVTAMLLALAAAWAPSAGAQDVRAQFDAIRTWDFNQPEDGLAAVTETVRSSLGDKQKCAAIEQEMIRLLEDNGATFGCKQFICRKLWKMGTERSVPALAKLLVQEEKISSIARYALGRNESAAAGQALRDALIKTSGRVRVGIINTIGGRRDAKAVPILRRLAASADGEVTLAAVCALGRIGTSDALGALQALPKPTHPAVAKATIECAHALAQSGETELAAEVYDGIYSDATYGTAPRIAALGGLLQTKPDKAVPILMTQFTGADATLRQAAAKYIRDIPGEAATRAFAKQLDSMSADSQVLLIGALADRGDGAAGPALMKAARTGEDKVRAAALTGLGSLEGSAEVTRLLVESAAAGADDVRNTARRSLTTMTGAAVNGTLIALAKAGQTAARVEAIEALGSRMAREAAQTLIGAASDADASVRTASFNALRGLVGPGDYPALIELLVAAEDKKERESAQRAVIASARQIDDVEGRAAKPIACMAGADAQTKESLLYVLAKLGGSRALTQVTKCSKDANPALKEAGIRALIGWSDGSAVAPLLEVIKSENDVTLKAISIDGLVQLMALPADRKPAETLAIYKSALGLTKRADDKKRLLSGLSAIGSPEAYLMVVPLWEDQALRQEATLAMAEITRAMAASYPTEARENAEKLLEHATLDAAKKKAQETIDFLERNEDFIVVWRMSEIYKQSGKDGAALYDIAFAPEKDPAAGKWRVVAANKDDVILDFDPLGGDNQVIYLRAELTAPAAVDARLEIGSDDGVKAWLNGKLVHQVNASRGVTVGQDKVTVKLQAGENKLLLKVIDRSANMGACCRVRAANGGKIKGLSFAPTTAELQGKI